MDAPSTKRRHRMQEHPENAITIAVSSGVLFNNDQERQIYERGSMEDIISLMMQGAQPFSPGPAFSFVKALETVNIQLRELYPDSEELFRVILMTNNDTRVGLTDNPIDDLKAYHTKLYLSADAQKVQEALKEGIAAATMVTPENMTEVSDTQLRVAFDGDGVLFSDESERVTMLKGLEKFIKHETDHVDEPLGHGPMKGFLEALGKLQKKFYAKGQRKGCPIRTYLVTSRGTASDGIRALKTLYSWGLEIDEAVFLGGAPKGPVLEAIRPHIFFDDKESHVRAAANIGTVACHVPYGISQTDTR
ncbi:uncharacterized protein V6R79_000019 [Siganus canaliculatus]